MRRTWPTAAKVLTGFFVTAMYAMPQAYTISAKPGVVNYIEGNAFVNGRPISPQNLKATFVNANDTISTDIGKAEVLLSPGVFLRLGENTQVRMISPSLTDTQLEIKSGTAMIEADDIVKDTRVTVLDSGGSVLIDRSGLYKFTAGDSPSAAVLEGKAEVYFGDHKTELGKGRQVVLGQVAKAQKFDAKKEDDLYAWSNVRSQYHAAASYQASRDVNASSYGGVWGGYGFGGYASPGWMWNSGFNTWSWLPGDGAFYSPFGYGFYSPGLVGYAPVIYAPVYGGGGVYRGQPVRTTGSGGGRSTTAANKPVPVNPVRPPAVGTLVASPMANQAARTQSLHSFSATGFRTANGTAVPAGRAAVGFGGAAHAAGPAAVGGGRASGGVSTASAGGGGAHAGGGGAPGGGGGHH
jgi:hypothetical protein